MIPYGEGWPYPKREAKRGTSYRSFHDYDRDVRMIVALDADGTRRGIEVSGMVLACVLRPRGQSAESGMMLWGDEDAETLLQAPEAWTTAVPPIDPKALARAVFETDPEVRAFLDVVSDSVAPPQRPDADWGAIGDNVIARHERAIQIAWDRNENGYAQRSTNRANAIILSIEDAALSAPTGSAEPR